jgi:hypothetical protein
MELTAFALLEPTARCNLKFHFAPGAMFRR